MKIANIEVIEMEMPFARGVDKPNEVGFLNWAKLDFCLLKVETDNGIVGWGDAFSFQCRRAVAEAVTHMVVPRVIGRDANDVININSELQQALHLFGRYGITMFAISGLDIALWDIAAKASGMPLYKFLGASKVKQVPAYASLFRYEDPDLVADRVNYAKELAYENIKLHEIGIEEIRKARDVAGEDLSLMVDVNCPWTLEQAFVMARDLKELDLFWLEEPINPPEDFDSMARLRAETGISIAAGENASTAFEFKRMMECRSVDYAQPSVTKVGGITEFLKVFTLAEVFGTQIMPHSPYFGPGFLATLQLAQSRPNPGMIERIFIEPEAALYPVEIYTPSRGCLGVPDGNGLGLDPDLDVIKTYRIN
ncbi:MAG: hypothetical protein CMM58_01555 [Rhodospirillaceae bacterium]|nr:hypothetical protein [Rhodospirillaceae bacterium]